MGIWSLPRAVGLPVVAALFPIPKIALLPLFILWLGIGEASKVATIALGVFFPTVIATYSGIDSVPRNLIRMAQSFSLPWPAIVRKIVLPGALPGDPRRLPHLGVDRAHPARVGGDDRRAVRHRRSSS